MIWLLLLLLTQLSLASPTQSNKTEQQQVKIAISIIRVFNVNTQMGYADIKFWVLFITKKADPSLLKDIDFINTKNSKLIYSTIKKTSDNKNIIAGEYTARFYHHFKLDKFPFDTQNLKIVIESATHNITHLRFIPITAEKQYTFNNNMFLYAPTWKPIRTRLTARKHAYNNLQKITQQKKLNGTYSRVTLNLNISRHGFRAFTTLLSPMYLAFILSLIALYIPPRKGFYNPRFSLIGASVFALVGNHLMTYSITQHTHTFGLIDKLQLTTTAYLIFSLLIVLVSSQYWGEIDRDVIFKRVAWIGVGYFITYALINTLLILNAITN